MFGAAWRWDDDGNAATRDPGDYRVWRTDDGQWWAGARAGLGLREYRVSGMPLLADGRAWLFATASEAIAAVDYFCSLPSRSVRIASVLP